MGLIQALLGFIGSSFIEVTEIQPTIAPSVAPTPTPFPTVATPEPTLVPTAIPTSSPTPPPTASPSVAPSDSPSSSPSDVPSVVPTLFPSDSPTVVPSASPSSSPSVTPSANPTSSPTATPSDVPSMVPSSSPSASPSDTPTNIPSAVPTASPSATPSGSPSATPSVPPTSFPSDVPSMLPTQTPVYIRETETKFFEVTFAHALAISGPLDLSLYGAIFFGNDDYDPGHCVGFCMVQELFLQTEFVGYVVYEGGIFGAWFCGCLEEPICSSAEGSDNTRGVIYSSKPIEQDESCPIFTEYEQEISYVMVGLPADAIADSFHVANDKYSSAVLTCQIYCDAISSSLVFYPDMGGMEDNCYCLVDGSGVPGMCSLAAGVASGSSVGEIYSKASFGYCI